MDFNRVFYGMRCLGRNGLLPIYQMDGGIMTEMPERMRLLADMMLDGFNWGDCPWSQEFTTAIYDRLAGKIAQVPEAVRGEAFIEPYHNFLAASVNKEFLGAADLLGQCLNFTSSPEGETFWEAVQASFREIESLYEPEPPCN